MAGAEDFGAGNDAFVDEEYETAKQKYSEAIRLEPENPAYYLKRSICNSKLNDYQNSANDAEMSIKFDSHNAKAHFRLGISRFHLREFRTAKEAFMKVLALDEQNKEAAEWIKKCEAECPAETANQEIRIKDENASIENKNVKPVTSPTVRHDWYQTESHVVLTLMVKSRKKEDVEIEFGKQNLSITIKLSSDKDYNWELDLAHPIVPIDSVTKILSTKIELKLKKMEGIRWASLENQGEPVYAKLEDQGSDKLEEKSTRQYPSSGRKYHDWDKVAADIAKDEENEKKEGDAALNDLFQKIYANADEDTKRAMNKSFQESGGTVLSTNWKDIGKKKVECKPPDGMEYKKYEI